MRRVVVTGLGLVTPLGVGADFVWDKLISGHSGISEITKFDTSDLPVKIAAQIPRGDQPGQYNPDHWHDPKEQRKVDEFITYAICASDQAIKDSGWVADTYDKQTRTGVIIGSGIGGLEGIEEASITLRDKGPRRISPFFIPGRLINLASGHVSIRNSFKGPNHSVVTACSTGSHAIGDASRLIAFGDADVMIAGGTESPLCRLSIAGFAACRALSTGFNDKPTEASRPFDDDRDGFVMGEGAGIVVLEEYEHAMSRGARIYAELKGYGLSGDAHHITSPSEDGDGGFRSMSAALRNSGLDLSEISYVNAHGTSTPAGDEIEIAAVERLFKNHCKDLKMSSTKSSIGHLLGAAGSVEAIFSILSIVKSELPATLNLKNVCTNTEIDLLPKISQKAEVNSALSNSFGFGGTNASLIFSRI
ncbi:MAG: beta-ketoacyl-[acyl-carrier-protein] synthase II [Alphaproteobacteria bacterium]|nr:beta-ketoacyl-[acyl-carrier-protein] synthase II [Alphaproteobacteria bacterium]